MRRGTLSTMAQPSSRATLCRQQIAILLLMTCFALALTAPTSPSLAVSTILNGEALSSSKSARLESVNVISVTSTINPSSQPIIIMTSQKLSKIVNTLNSDKELLLSVPATTSSADLDTVTSENRNDVNEIITIKLEMVTTRETLIEGKSQQEDESSTIEIHTKKNNGTVKIHEPQETVSYSRMASTIKDENFFATISTESNENKSISSDVKESSDEQQFEAQMVATTIEMPIKLDADNSKVMENDRDSLASTLNQESVEEKKGKFKDSKKKALKATEKKQKLKQKLFSDINHLAFVPTNEATTQISTDKASELYETTHVATISTSIKTAPTTIKSTTLTTIKSFQLKSETTQPTTFTKERTSTETALNFNEMVEPKTSTEPSSTANEQHTRNHGDNVIVLNTNSSGLIVVDILENFGTENVSNNTETFEIKMDLIDDSTTTEGNHKKQESDRSRVADEIQKFLETNIKDDIFLTTIDTIASVEGSNNETKIDSVTTTNDDIILINENNDSTTTQSTTRIKWNQVKSNSNIKITFDNIDLPNQNVNVSIENGELVIDSIDISVLNKAEKELKKRQRQFNAMHDESKLNKTDSLEIILIEDDSHQDEKDINRDNSSENDESNLTTTTEGALKVNDEGVGNEKKINESSVEQFHSTTIHFDVPTMKHDHLKKIEVSESEEEDGIKIKTTDKDSDTVFYISNTEVKVIESIPTASPGNSSENKKYYPAIYEEDVIVDVPNKNRTSGTSNLLSSSSSDKYEEDIVLSPLTSDFDPKDINYIGEAFLDVEESQNSIGNSETHHIIPLTSDVVIQPVQLRDMPSIGIPIIGELPPQIELEEMVFSDDYDNKQQSNFRVEEYYPNFLSNRLVKNQLEADVPREMIFDSKNGTLVMPSTNRTHISINTMINGTNMTAVLSSFPNATAFHVESEENENADLNDVQTLLLACFATLMPLFLCVILALTIRYCWRKHRRQDSSGNDMMSDKSTDPLAEKNIASSVDELKPTESGMTLDGNMQASTEMLLAANGDITPTNHTGTNGSIITMTLKNNHLIVETEERNDISRDTRETKMHYSPSEKDGVFIVEAARGADQNGSHKPSPLQQKPTEAPLVIPEEIKIDTLQSHFTPSSPEEEHKQPKPEQVEVHTPPAELKEDGGKKYSEQAICNGTKTGLSQSDLSLTSSNSSNQNYSYGDKEPYHYEEKGYKASSPKRIINVHCHDLKPLIENSPPVAVAEDLNKPVITSAIFKNGPQENREYLKSDAQATEQSGGTILPKNEDLEKAKIHKINGIIIKNGLDEIISVPDENCNDAIISPSYMKNDCNGDTNGLDSLSFLPAPPAEISNDHTSIMELTSIDSLPPPPPEMTRNGAQS